MRSGARRSPPGLHSYFERTFLDHPWFDPELPSLVFDDGQGGVAAFIGSTVRRMRFDGRRIRIAFSGPLIADPDGRTAGAGALLMREFLRGPQELTATDGANNLVRKIWTRLGGDTSPLNCLRWMRVFRPVRTVEESLLSKRQAFRAAAVLARIPVDSMAGRLLKPKNAPAVRELIAEDLTPQLLVAHLPVLTATKRLVPDYDVSFLQWMFHEMACLKARGQFVATLLRNRQGRVIGWYIAFFKRGGVSRVLQIVADGDHAALVVDHLVATAFEYKVACLIGRVESQIQAALWEKRYLLSSDATGLMLVHTKDAEIAQAIYSGHALLTRMEGETWFGHRTESFA